MFFNLLKVAFRNISREKIYSLINVIGLTIGISCSVFLLLYILDELSYDEFHRDRERIFRVVTHFQEPDNKFSWPLAQIPLAEELGQNFTEVEQTVRMISAGKTLIDNPTLEKKFYEENWYYADTSFFEVFGFELTAGDAKQALRAPNSLVLTEEMAVKYFDQKQPIGEILQVGDEPCKVTAIVSNLPHNTHMEFDALMSRSSLPEQMGSWTSWGVSTYLRLRPEVEYTAFLSRFNEYINKNYLRPVFGPLGVSAEYDLQPIERIHLYSHLEGESGGGDISYIYIFAVVGVFMLVIAAINYMNLATARAGQRAKEVGIRKTAGSSRMQLVRQFLTESVILTLAALLVSILLVTLLLPGFNYISGKEISSDFLFQPYILFSLLLIVLLTGLAGGSYPAFYLSGFNPAQVLKGQKSSGTGSARLRKILVVAQFAISITMVVSTWVVYDQLQYIRSKDLGFDKKRVVVVDLSEPALRKNYEVLRNRLMDQPQIAALASANATPGDGISKNIVNIETENEGFFEKGVNSFYADYDFAEALGFRFVEGRNFSRDYATDTAAALVNQAMVARMGWENPIGKKIEIMNGSEQSYKVVGVVENYHQRSLYATIEPLAIYFRDRNPKALIKLQAGNPELALATLEESWNEVNNNKPLEYQFLDESFDEQYQADIKRGQIFTLFSALTVIVACLGLLGLAAYTTRQRDKEIGIRKVIGASVGSILLLIYKDFIILIGIAVVIAFPFAYYFMDNWLQEFAYQTSIKPISFVASALLTLLVTVITVGFHTLRAATTDPVKSIRDQ